MKLKLTAAMVSLAIIAACGGGGGDDLSATPQTVTVVNPEPLEETNREAAPDAIVNAPVETIVTEDRTRPTSGLFSSDSTELKSNGSDLHSNDGSPPQRVSPERVVSWPGLRYGDFLVSNNPWNASSASFPLWYQEISLYETDSGWGVQYDWDWGAETDTAGSIFNTKSYPEVIYGTKSPGERSGDFSETGLPVEIFDAPEFTIDYSYRYEGRRTDSATPNGTDAEFNVAIESFYHSSCDIKRSGLATDNTVMETMVWLRVGDRKPSGDPIRNVVTTSDGKSYDVYTKVASNPNYIAFVAQVEEQTGSVMYSELLDHAQDFAADYGIYPLKDTDCLANILVGTEIWHGAGTFNLDSLRVNRSY